jgi:rubrerythrin
LLDFKDSQTLGNLIEQLSRDAQSIVRYRLFARTAEYEGLSETADLFRRLAQNEAVYAEGHLEFIRAAYDPLSRRVFGQTVENLAAATLAEQEDVGGLDPDFARVAECEGFDAIASWFRTLAVAKREHLARLRAVAAAGCATEPAQSVEGR